MAPPFPSQIFDVQFNPHSSGSLVTCGVKHIKFWTLCGNSLSGKKGIFGKKGWGVSERGGERGEGERGEGRREGERREGERGRGERGRGEKREGESNGGRGVKEGGGKKGWGVSERGGRGGGRRGEVGRERTEGKGI